MEALSLSLVLPLYPSSQTPKITYPCNIFHLRISDGVSLHKPHALSLSTVSLAFSTASLASLPSLTLRNPNKALNLRSAFVPQNGLRKGFACGGLKWRLETQNRQVTVPCDAAVAEKEVADTPGEEFQYQAEVSRLMDLIVHSLYSHKKVFLGERVSNASDALDKLRFLSVTEPSLLGDAVELQIRIKPDPENGTITITDTGIGTKEELIDCLGTIAQSGTSKFLTALKENKDLGADNGLIGQFGVGFYSAFLVADKGSCFYKKPKIRQAIRLGISC